MVLWPLQISKIQKSRCKTLSIALVIGWRLFIPLTVQIPHRWGDREASLVFVLLPVDLDSTPLMPLRTYRSVHISFTEGSLPNWKIWKERSAVK